MTPSFPFPDGFGSFTLAPSQKKKAPEWLPGQRTRLKGHRVKYDPRAKVTVEGACCDACASERIVLALAEYNPSLDGDDSILCLDCDHVDSDPSDDWVESAFRSIEPKDIARARFLSEVEDSNDAE